jgi:peptidoglycan/xylan/chitin deacetylase (PgdA/CDA1 family)
MSLSRRDVLKIGGAALLSAALSPVIRALADTAAPSVFWSGLTRLPKVALTYDDCYLVTVLQKLEKTLEQFPNVRVTFFAVGDALLSTDGKDPGIWQRFAARGHDIGYHTMHHDNPQLLSAQGLLRDYDIWLDVLRKVLGREPLVHFARPPFWNICPQFLTMCKERGLVCAMYSWGWGGTDVNDVVQYNVPKTKNGDIVSMHIRTFDWTVTEQGLPWLAKQGMQAVTLKQLYYDYRKAQLQSSGCEIPASNSLTRTCID